MAERRRYPCPSQRCMHTAIRLMSGIPDKDARLAAAYDVARRAADHYRALAVLLQGTEQGDEVDDQRRYWDIASWAIRGPVNRKKGAGS